MRNPGKVWTIVETGKIAFSINSEQEQKFIDAKKVLIYITEVTQLTLFEDLPPKEECRRVLKDITKLKLTGFID